MPRESSRASVRAARAARSPIDDGSEAPRGRARLIAGIVASVALLLGAGASAMVQRAAADARAADSDAVARLAAQYLDAIEDGRAADATALVPVEGDEALLVDAVLGAAVRISDAVVRRVDVGGDGATVQVAYRAWNGPVRRAIDAQRTPEGWRLTTSLAEPVALEAEPVFGVGPSIAGLPLAVRGASLLYPGLYLTDAARAAVWTLSPARVAVDGDPSTVTHPVAMQLAGASSPLPAMVDLAALHLAACRDAGACVPAPRGLDARLGETTWSSLGLAGDGGVAGRIGSAAERAGEQVEVVVDVLATATGRGAVAWSCAGPVPLDDAGTAPFGPCGGAPP